MMTEPPPDITIVGLGPGDPARRTVEVQKSLDNAEQLFLRTASHPGIEDLVCRENVVVCDQTPGRHAGDWSVEATLVCDAASSGPVVLAVPGHPRFGERLVMETIAEARRRNLNVDILDGLGVIDVIATALDIDPLVDDVQIVDARQLVESAPDDVFRGGFSPFTPLRPMLFSRVYGTRVTEPLSRILLRVLPPDHPVTIVEAAGIPGEQAVERTTVAGLGAIRAGSLASVLFCCYTWGPASRR